MVYGQTVTFEEPTTTHCYGKKITLTQMRDKKRDHTLETFGSIKRWSMISTLMMNYFLFTKTQRFLKLDPDQETTQFDHWESEIIGSTTINILLFCLFRTPINLSNIVNHGDNIQVLPIQVPKQTLDKMISEVIACLIIWPGWLAKLPEHFNVQFQVLISISVAGDVKLRR